MTECRVLGVPDVLLFCAGQEKRGLETNVKACINLGYLINEGGKPRVLRCANPEVKVIKELAQNVTAEHIRINKTNGYELVAEKRIPLIDVLRVYLLEEIRETDLQYMRRQNKRVPSRLDLDQITAISI